MSAWSSHELNLALRAFDGIAHWTYGPLHNGIVQLLGYDCRDEAVAEMVCFTLNRIVQVRHANRSADKVCQLLLVLAPIVCWLNGDNVSQFDGLPLGGRLPPNLYAEVPGPAGRHLRIAETSQC